MGWEAIAGALLTLAVKLILLWLGNAEEKREAKKRFLAFVSVIGSQHGISVRLNEEDRRQLEELERLRPDA